MSANPDLESASVLSFDIYGTLVDWEGGMLASLLPLTSQLPDTHPSHPSSPTHHDSAIAAFIVHEERILKEKATTIYEMILEEAYHSLAKVWNLIAQDSDAKAVGDNIGNWKAFPDTIEAMSQLRKHCKLVVLSNVSRGAFRKTMEGPLKDVKFDAIHVAEDIGSYKPDPKNFIYLLNKCKEDFGVERDALVHVAHGVTSDQVPAEQMDIGHVWIRRGKDNWGDRKMFNEQVRFETLGDFAKELSAIKLCGKEEATNRVIMQSQ